MLLRTRITLMVCLCSSALAGLLLTEGRLRTQTAEAAYQEARVSALRNAWDGIERSVVMRLENFARSAASLEGVTHAVATANREVLEGVLADMVARVQLDPDVDLLLVVDASGKVLFSTDIKLFDSGAPNWVKDLLKRAQRDPRPQMGPIRDGQSLLLSAAIPLRDRRGLGGLVIASANSVQGPVKALQSSMGGAVYVTFNAEKPVVATTNELWPFAAEVMDSPNRSEQGMRYVQQAGKTATVAWTPMDSLQGSSASGVLLATQDVTEAEHKRRLYSWLSLGGMGCALALFLAYLYWYMRHSFRPLNAVIRGLNALSHGRVDVHLPKRLQADEIGQLASTVHNFREAQIAREQLTHIRQELDTARQIQSSILRTDFPEWPDLSLHAYMRAAREVGGDFYDFFELPNGRIGLVIADVSGKGMPAALFMAVARTVLHSTAMNIASPGECLAQANDLLCHGNSQGMFVTVFYGVLERESGRLLYANGGHNPPLVRHADGRVTALATTKGTALGLFDGLIYREAEMVLQPQEHLFLYTDGLTEAQNIAQELYNQDRLEQALAQVLVHDSADMITRLLAAVDSFVADAPQADDMTCLAVYRR